LKSFTSWSIRTHLLIFVAMVILPSLGILIHGEMQQRREALRSTHDRMRAAVTGVGQREEALIWDAHRMLSVLAQLPNLGTPGRKRYLPLFQQLFHQNPSFDNIFYADLEGRVLLAAAPVGPSQISDRTYFRTARDQRRFTAGGYIFSRGTRRPVMPLALPVLDSQGKTVGILATGISLAALGQHVGSDLLKLGQLEILDHEGRLLYSSEGKSRYMGMREDPARFQRMTQGGADSSFRESTKTGTDLIQVHRLEFVPGAPEAFWLCMAVPEGPVLHTAQTRLYLNLATLAALTLALIALAWWIGAALIAVPISRLVTVAQRMADGGFAVRTGLADGRNEVGRLARAFERLGSRLEVREQQLRRTLEKSNRIAHRFQSLEAHNPDGVFWLRPLSETDYVYEDINPAFERMNATLKAEIQGKRPQEILDPDHAEGALAHFRECMTTGRPCTIQTKIVKGDFTRIAEIQLIPLREATGKIDRLVGFFRDITEAKGAEEAIRQSQKLNSLGLLAGGIAHDFNNLLTAILGNLNLAQIKLGEGNPGAAFLENIERTVIRASDLTRQLLAYSGRGHFVVKPLDLNAVVQEMTHLLEVSIPKKVQLDYRFAENLPPVEADFTQIQQVVMNLVTNASEAIGEKEGSISITTRSAEINERFISATFPDQPIEPGLFVILEASDNGCGMSREVLNHIFDPFFTTKSSGRGLGLSAMLGILRGHRAGIKIYSELGRGTVFKLFFPAARGAILPPDYVSPSIHIAAEGTILVVDDEADIRETASIALETMGFTVITAADGREAVEVYGNYRDEIRAVLMDLTMPHLDGKEAFQQIRALNPQACVILSSGYSELDIRHSFSDQTPSGFIQKPYHYKDLQRILKDCLYLGSMAQVRGE